MRLIAFRIIPNSQGVAILRMLCTQPCAVDSAALKIASQIGSWLVYLHHHYVRLCTQLQYTHHGYCTPEQAYI